MDNAFSLANYLGCPIIDSRISENTFREVVDKYFKQLTRWKQIPYCKQDIVFLFNVT